MLAEVESSSTRAMVVTLCGIVTSAPRMFFRPNRAASTSG